MAASRTTPVEDNMSAAGFLAWACRVVERSKEVMQDGKPIPPRSEQSA
jgi:hypothetical protein